MAIYTYITTNDEDIAIAHILNIQNTTRLEQGEPLITSDDLIVAQLRGIFSSWNTITVADQAHEALLLSKDITDIQKQALGFIVVKE